MTTLSRPLASQAFGQLYELFDLDVVLLAVRFDTAADINGPRSDLLNARNDIVSIESSSQNNRHATLSLLTTLDEPFRDGPVEHLAGATTQRVLARADLGVEQRHGVVARSRRILKRRVELLARLHLSVNMERLDDRYWQES